MMQILSEGFILGISTGGFCLASCAPVFIPYLLAESASSFKKLTWQILQFLAGRFTAYIIFAVLAGYVGGRMQGAITPRLAGISLIVTALILLFYSLIKNAPHMDFCKKYAKSRFVQNIPFLFGFLIGINICPPFILGLTRIIELGSILLSVVFFAAFFAGTSLYLVPLLFLKPVLKHEKAASIGQLASIIAGIYFLVIGIIAII